jgi:preprotein translocase subunit SecG
MLTYFIWAQIVLSVSLIIVLLMQSKGGGLGGIFGQSDSVYRTKRGTEKLLFQFTIVLVVLLVVISLIMLKLS